MKNIVQKLKNLTEDQLIKVASLATNPFIEWKVYIPTNKWIGHDLIANYNDLDLIFQISYEEDMKFHVSRFTLYENLHEYPIREGSKEYYKIIEYLETI